jgi:hypothetical protein
MEESHEFENLLVEMGEMPGWASNPQMLSRAREAWYQLDDAINGDNWEDTLEMDRNEVALFQALLQGPGDFFQFEWLLPEAGTVALAIEEGKRCFNHFYTAVGSMGNIATL